MESKESKESKTWNLQKENELRIETKGKIKLKLTKGTAEIFGSELILGKAFTLENCKVAIFTWNGCVITVTGKWEVAYTSEETPMVSYINTHAALQKLREDSKKKGSKGMGPVVVIAGPKDSGKSTLARILLSYAVRCGWKPTFVDLDVGQNEITSPGCIAACPVDEPVGVDSFWNNRAPVVYFYGHTAPSQNKDIYKRLCGKLAETVKKRAKINASARHSGTIISTCGWTDSGGQELLQSIATKFGADVILVLGQERLVNDLKSSKDVKELGTTVVKLDKSGGVVMRSAKLRGTIRSTKIRQYFYGRMKDLSPHEKVISFSEVLVYKLGGGVKAPTAALPIGQKPLLDPNRVLKVNITSALQHCILAVSYAKSSEQLLEMNIAGLVFVKEVDTKKQQMTVLAPSSGNLPHRFLLHGTLKWFDS
mmetsp:Transcript_10631/g.15863  ORF Transcript_10631/g.15863 Transcript_10631/m.15863 type:complete len:424 (-) Transcript_10631:91-1362(-)